MLLAERKVTERLEKRESVLFVLEHAGGRRARVSCRNPAVGFEPVPVGEFTKISPFMSSIGYTCRLQVLMVIGRSRRNLRAGLATPPTPFRSGPSFVVV